MEKYRGTGQKVPIFLVLILLLTCSLNAMGQWQGVNYSATDSNSNVVALTSVTSTAGAATFTANNSFVAGQYLAISAKVSGTTQTDLTGNFVVASATSTSFIVNGAFAVRSDAVTLGSSTATMMNADPVTFRPGKTYTGTARCLNCHSQADQNSSFVAQPSLSNIQNSPFDPNGYILTGHPNVVRKVAPPGTYPMGGVAKQGFANPLPDHLVSSLGVDLPTTNWIGGTYPTGYVFNWNLGAVNFGGTNYPLTYTTGGWSEEANPDDVFMLDSTNLSTAIMYVASDGTHNTGSSYSCARCHVAGYRFDGLATEPSVANADGSYTKLTDAQLKRVPAGWSASSGRSSSWFETGITCNRCHGVHWCTGATAKTAPDGTSLNPPPLDATGTPQCGWIDASVVPNVVRIAQPYQPVNQQATALCIECHRRDANNTTTHTISLVSPPGAFSAPGSSKCSDGSAKTVAECLNAGLIWTLPGVGQGHGANGAQTFLSSPHAKWTPNCSKNPATNTTQALCTAAGGNWGLVQNAQNSPDMSVQMNGTYASHFKDWGEGMTADEEMWNSDPNALTEPNPGTDSNCAAGNTRAQCGDGPKPLANGGCTGCHNVHYSTLNPTPPAGWAMTVSHGHAGNDSPDPEGTPLAFARPSGKTCLACHTGSHAITVFKHPTGAGTPFDMDGTGTQDANTACVTCHMASAGAGNARYHYFRINPDPKYFTYSAYNVYGCSGTAPNIACGSAIANTPVSKYDDGTGYQGAGLDVDIACGQCHGGGNSSTQGPWQNPYGITPPSPVPVGFSRAYLGMAAAGMHGAGPSGSTPAAAPTFSLAGGTYSTAQTVFLSDATPGATIYYTTDGSTPAYPMAGATAQYTPGAPITVAATTTINAIAGGPGFTSSTVATAAYKIIPIPAAPTFTPASGIYTGTQTVGLTTSTPNTGTTFYYTTNGTTPTTASTACAAPCSVSVGTSQTVKAIAVYTNTDGSQTSGVATAIYRILAVPAPTFSPAPYPSMYYAITNVSMSDTASGVTICYTTNGTIPVVGATSGTCAVGTPYTASIALARFTITTVKAVAGGPGFVSSPVVSALYVIR